RFVTAVLSETAPGSSTDELTLLLNKPWETVSTETDPLAAAVFTNTAIPNQASVDVSRAQHGGSGKDEIDIVTVTATDGHYELTLDGATTGQIASNASDSDVRNALVALHLSGLDVNHIDVIKTIPGFLAKVPGDQEIYTITFKDELAHTLTSI